jgi:pimeloyl-ACP methyl ester carboxylesterase
MIKLFIFKVLRFVLVAIILIVLTQDLQLFPRAFLSLFQSKKRNPSTVPHWVRSSFIETSDKKKIEVWHVAADEEAPPTSKVAILFHGNGDLVDNFVGLQVWFSQQGIASYSFDYRGYGKSTGWPSESGLYLDSQAVWEHVVSETSAQPQDIIIVGFSIGTALAAKLAAEKNVGTLVLLSAYTNLPDVVRERALFRPLVPFLKYKFPTTEYLAQLKETDLVLAHGVKDEVIGFSHFDKVAASYSGRGELITIIDENATHNDLFWRIRSRLGSALASLQ